MSIVISLIAFSVIFRKIGPALTVRTGPASHLRSQPMLDYLSQLQPSAVFVQASQNIACHPWPSTNKTNTLNPRNAINNHTNTIPTLSPFSNFLVLTGFFFIRLIRHFLSRYRCQQTNPPLELTVILPGLIFFPACPETETSDPRDHTVNVSSTPSRISSP